MNHRFVVVFTDGTVISRSEGDISSMYDLADTGIMDEVQGVYVYHKGSFKKVDVGNSSPINEDEELPFYYAKSPMYVENTEEVVGYISWTDH